MRFELRYGVTKAIVVIMNKAELNNSTTWRERIENG